ncbi:hypothetical protein HN51_035822 [Arachis hypogaea]|uniref:IST1-like protein n=1 Tax=Arachis hypogaea TaxID=3818 RepID=A0A445A2X4_ARAHY|nr:uncharacterized protein LOC107630298 [Arachis ipaensis]XP_025644194.1 uncharacterized protein LOC112738115 [Arachis hypogaea]QHO01024.1 IST1-like protein [Arachis hypogaea]RYR20758.1 hypothetical protein Ahy_B03g065986 isoform B [Arachis hypogaea]
MLDGLLGRGFAAKCKSLIKLTKSRIDVIRRKRRATEKFLKKDMADLLTNGLDINAYGRAEGLLVELTLSSCYDFVEQSCEFVLKHLSVMHKLSGCPEECRDAVASLMFAAARFSDLPELRDLRQMFQERYGNSIECYVNQEFAANLNFKSSTLEKKVYLMQRIASEFSIKWDSKDFEQRMSKSSTFAQGHDTRTSNPLTDNNIPSHAKCATTTGVKHDTLFDKSPDHPNKGYRFQNGKEAVVLNRDDGGLQFRSTHPANGFKPLNAVEVIQKRDIHDNPLTGRHNNNWKENSMLKPNQHSSQKKTVEQFEGRSMLQDNSFATRQDTTKRSDSGGYRKEGSMPKSIGHSLQEKTERQFQDASKLHDSCGDTTHLRENHDSTTARKSPSRLGMRFKSNADEPFAANDVTMPDTDNLYRKVQKDETPKQKPYYSNVIPPPYVKPKSKQQNSIFGVNMSSNIDSDGTSIYLSAHDKPDTASTSERIQIGWEDDDPDQHWQANRHKRPSKQSHEKGYYVCEDANEASVLKPKSTRRKHLRSRSSHTDAKNEDTGPRRKSRSRSRRRGESRHGLQTLLDDERYQNAEEERLIDKLLIHYSKKPSIIVPEKLRRNSKNSHPPEMDHTTREFLQNERQDGSDKSQEMATYPPRSVSLPREQTRAVEIKKVYTRAATFQPDRSEGTRHVHPKLPDYDDLAARFAALRGR